MRFSALILGIFLIVAQGLSPAVGAASEVGWIAGGEISALTLYRPDELQKVLECQHNARFNTLFVTVKQFDGRLWYYSEEFPELMATPAPNIEYTKVDNPLQKIVDAAEAAQPRQGVVALFQAFNDKHAAWNLFPEARIRDLDWVDPAYKPMQDYLISLAVDLVRSYDIDGISLDMVRYPTGIKAEMLPYTKDGDRVEIITQFVARLTRAVKEVDPTVEVSANVFAAAVYGPVAEIGQDLGALEGALDYVFVMLYPYDDDQGPVDDRKHYQFQLKNVQSALRQVSNPDFLKVAVQGFFGYDMSDVAQQINGVRDGGGTGVMVYAYDFAMGWESAEWKAVASAMPENPERRRFRTDTQAPVLDNIAKTGNSLTFTTEEVTRGTVRYGIFDLVNEIDTGWGYYHAAVLPLIADLPHQYEIEVVDRRGNRTITRGGMTGRPIPEAGPEVTWVTVGDVTDIWARISWKTNLPTTGVVEVQGPNGIKRWTDRRLATDHEVLIHGLEGGRRYTLRLQGVDCWGRSRELRQLQFQTPRNLAAGKQASASSAVHRGFEADKAVDGDLQTRWCSNYSDLEYITIDLGEPQVIRGVGIEWEYAYARAYKLRVSTDGRRWATVYSTTEGQGGREDIHFAPTKARYVQLVATERGTGLGYSIWEFKVF